ncbi:MULTISPECIES: DUF2625 family protein [unclassified Streptomyces]|uniref:DUF2625 family protein n=1 Tax=unclassified Streptomyces TaxID=2593676 RepID=UPI0036F891B6
MREVDELINVDDPAWPLLLQELSATDVPVEALPGDAETGRPSLLQLQVSARSNLGGVVLNSGGLLADSGWLRIFGTPGDAHAEMLPALAEINARPSTFSAMVFGGAGCRGDDAQAVRRASADVTTRTCARETGPGGSGEAGLAWAKPCL